jgi:hypothetical protein
LPPLRSCSSRCHRQIRAGINHRHTPWPSPPSLCSRRPLLPSSLVAFTTQTPATATLPAGSERERSMRRGDKDDIRRERGWVEKNPSVKDGIRR